MAMDMVQKESYCNASKGRRGFSYGRTARTIRDDDCRIILYCIMRRDTMVHTLNYQHNIKFVQESRDTASTLPRHNPSGLSEGKAPPPLRGDCKAPLDIDLEI